jgi:hypothetical protein
MQSLGKATDNEWWRWRPVEKSDTWYCHQHMQALGFGFEFFIPNEGRLYSSNIIILTGIDSTRGATMS